MRNVSDPELPQRLKDKHSMVSMSTVSSSFSRSSHDRYTNDNASQYSRGTNFSAMSDGSSACDLSRDPDILALAGLSMKPRPSEDYEPAPVQRPQMLNSKTYEHQVIEEPEREEEAVDKDVEENSFNERTVPTSWPGSNVDARSRSYTTSTRDDLPVPQSNTIRPADVLHHRSQTTAAMAWNPSATAPLPSSSSVKDLNTKSNTFASPSIGRFANNSLPQSGQIPANFVVFSDSRRESIFTRADDGQDMIPLDF